MRVLPASVSASVFVIEHVCAHASVWRCVCMSHSACWRVCAMNSLCACPGIGFMPNCKCFSLCLYWIYNKEEFVRLQKAVLPANDLIQGVICVNAHADDALAACFHTHICIVHLNVHCKCLLLYLLCVLALLSTWKKTHQLHFGQMIRCLDSHSFSSFPLFSPLILYLPLMFHSACNYSHGTSTHTLPSDVYRSHISLSLSLSRFSVFPLSF